MFTQDQVARYVQCPSTDMASVGLGLKSMDSITTGTNNIVISTGNASNLPSSASNTLTISGGATAILSATNTNTTPVVSFPGGIVNSVTPAGATLAVTSGMSGGTILLNTAAGSTATLPAATGSGAKYRFVVSTTASSNAHKILPASVSDFMTGNAVGHTAAGATLAFSGNPAASHSIQMPFAGTQPSGGFSGDYFEVTDIAANLWAVAGMYQAGTTATTPFSAATT